MPRREVGSVVDYIGQAVPIPGSSKADRVFERISSADIRPIEKGHRTVDDALDRFEMEDRQIIDIKLLHCLL